jgi:hypothetical protein
VFHFMLMKRSRDAVSHGRIDALNLGVEWGQGEVSVKKQLFTNTQKSRSNLLTQSCVARKASVRTDGRTDGRTVPRVISVCESYGKG